MRKIRLIVTALVVMTITLMTSVQARRSDQPSYWIRSAPFQVYAFYGADPNTTFDCVPPYNDSTNYSSAGFWGIQTYDCPNVAAVAEAVIPGMVPHAWIEATTLSAATPLINAWTDNPSYRAWYLKDEPTAAEIPGVADIANYLKADANKSKSLIYVNICYTHTYDPGTQTWSPNTPYLDQIFSQIQPDALCFDYYPNTYDWATGSIPKEEMYPGWFPTLAWNNGWFNTLATVVNYVKTYNAANNKNISTIACVQSFAADTRTPPLMDGIGDVPASRSLDSKYIHR